MAIHGRFYSQAILILIASITPSIANGAETYFTPSIYSGLNYIESVSPTSGSQEYASYELTPIVSFSYDSTKLTADTNIQQRNIYRDINDDSNYEGYVTSNYSVRYDVINSKLVGYVNGSQSYNSLNSSSFIIDDLTTRPDNFTKIRSNTAGVELSAIGNAWFLVSGDTSASLYESEETINNSGSLNSLSYRSAFTLSNGQRFSDLDWSISSLYRKTDREDSEDTELRNINANVDYFLTRYLAINFTANESAQNFGNDVGTDIYRTYGIGMLYQSNNNFFRANYNTVDERSEFSEEDDSSFYSMSFNFAFSPRTNISGSREQDFYGSKESFSLNYANRKARVAINYGETVTSISSVFDSTGAGVFVCPTNYLSIDECFIPQTLNYQLGIGEQFTDLSLFQDGLDNNERIRKSWSINSGYQSRKLTLSAQASRASTNLIDSTGDTRQNSYAGYLNYQIGSKTYLTGQLSYLETEELDEENSDSRVWSGYLGVNYNLNNKITASTRFEYSDYKTQFELTNYQERRLTLNIQYTPSGRENSSNYSSGSSNSSNTTSDLSY